jgi:hypothetical protein
MANAVPSCYRPVVGHLGDQVRKHEALLLAAAMAAVVSSLGCSRTGLGISAGAEQPEVVDAAEPGQPVNGGSPDAAAAGTSTPPSVEVPNVRVPHCTPSSEICNGKDDDCNGKVDDGIASVPCSGGGQQYCVAGRLSACPTRCDACIPGSERVCFHSYCTFWAVQACTADGKSFGICREKRVPSECADVSDRYHESAQLEQCCIDNGYCCHDEFDLDHDGDRGEMLGTCDEVSCDP